MKRKFKDLSSTWADFQQRHFITQQVSNQIRFGLPSFDVIEIQVSDLIRTPVIIQVHDELRKNSNEKKIQS